MSYVLFFGVISGRFLFADGRCVFRRPTCYPRMCLTAPDDVCVSEEEQARPIYRAGSDQLTQGRGGSAPFQKVVSLAVSFSFSKGSFFPFPLWV
jgi:hypothetical protein